MKFFVSFLILLFELFYTKLIQNDKNEEDRKLNQIVESEDFKKLNNGHSELCNRNLLIAYNIEGFNKKKDYQHLYCPNIVYNCCGAGD